jgi:hypothetical protein
MPTQADQNAFLNPVFSAGAHQPTSGFQNLSSTQPTSNLTPSTFNYYNAGQLPEQQNFAYVQRADGGGVGSSDTTDGDADTEGAGDNDSSFAVRGAGDGRSDSIPAKLSDGEYVMDAETVGMLGNGSTKAGAAKLDALRVNLRKHKGRNLAQGKISLSAKPPAAYMRGGRT